MKYITSTTGEKIPFNLNKDRRLVIEMVIPTEVSDEEYAILYGRLGTAIKDNPMNSETVSDTVAPAVETSEPELKEEVIAELKDVETKIESLSDTSSIQAPSVPEVTDEATVPESAPVLTPEAPVSPSFDTGDDAE